ncbi:MAG: hypothetical protein J6C98_10240 [Oscillospiraceae bacterium]|nr:hypothetical protein [Oscillospiraceae bacterium]
MDTKLIKMVISTLNGVEVKGKVNLDRLLGCINALESVAKAAEQIPAGSVKLTEEEDHG